MIYAAKRRCITMKMPYISKKLLTLNLILAITIPLTSLLLSFLFPQPQEARIYLILGLGAVCFMLELLIARCPHCDSYKAALKR